MPLSLSPERQLVWHPSDPVLADAAREGDLKAIDALVALEALPPALLRELARTAVQRDPVLARQRATGRIATDPRLKHMLPAPASHAPRSCPRQTTTTRLDGREFASAAPWGDRVLIRDTEGALYAASDVGLRPLGGPCADALPHPLSPRETRAVAVARDEDRAQAWIVNDEPSPALWSGLSVGHPTRWHIGGQNLAIIGQAGVSVLTREGDGVHYPPVWPYPPAPVLTSEGDILLMTPGQEGPDLVWLDPQGPTVRARAAVPGVISGLAVHDGVAWATGDAGLYRVSLGSTSASLVAAGSWFSLVASPRGPIAIGQSQVLLLPCMTPIPLGEENALAAWVVGDGVLWSGTQHWWLTDFEGRERARSRDGGTTTVARCDDVTAILCGTDLALVDSRLDVRARARLEQEGALYGATRHAFIVGPHQGGHYEYPLSGWWAFDQNAGLVSQLASAGHRWPLGTASSQRAAMDAGLIHRDAVWCLFQDELIRWVPSHHADNSAFISAPPQRTTGVVHRGHCSGHPTDARPDPGATVDRREAHFDDCTFAGSSMPAPAASVEVTRGGIATLTRCRLEGFADIRVGVDSTAIVIDAVVAPDRTQRAWIVETGGHLVVLGGSGLHTVHVTLGLDATLEVDGQRIARGPAEVRNLSTPTVTSA